MSSWKKAAKASQKTHRERHQPEARKFLGLLEKKKDYVARARDYNEKQATLKQLRKRALNKNPDEFYFHMINAKVKDGIHQEKDMEEKYTPDQIKLMKTQDLKYISYKRNLERMKVEKLHSTLHMIDAANEVENQHIFFVDDSEDVKNFDLCQRLNTHPALLNRRTNRPRLDALQKMKLPELDESTLHKIEQRKLQAYKELSKRVDREKQLTVVQQVLEVKNALRNRKVTQPIQVKRGSKDSAPIYRWKYERKR
ncbi:probable U3 small nucleolar RNA-associated protein 11 [Copidosoma floridanum]|uniref:probable U3 small nucleolar RNA-associated protein 11 n=1 Tax=Copidosoma floridanum TaxID=29053 RepID=UPI0006C9A9B7|nr:probable U3 small nucleolar RNA-associated protein 11 [Copidosoma floridanum]XP_014218111.1 probable U3 small nucleolar RNA-associated protein 11 [Copidosoma floridanum]